MTDLILAGTALSVTLTICVAALRGWSGWLELRRLELGRQMPREGGGETGLRIELADVRERLRKLEALADDVEL